ncbi:MULTISPECIES: hypothetical protein [Streptomyces]|uniref:DUF3618 domain-containing protein n=2 Tax=Streptomyces TaxID=1883 RepID=A0A1D8FYS5_9ACTN|nr:MULTISPECIES: hypothetical protein [Streptomyces]AOT58316.1 hypothetical protein A4G23_01125 [Streptomyces rubrolavendulae]KAF0651319.1 hypothetical protein K701_04100 [Streptomyces fradiae ATCC 10745 = DSM 40063]OSY50391.1 hypothetical protein BG846_03967 [Streptomyces fradiae ATCC 10745 = DSM 40063]QEV11686.1 hypothetical protein CP974_06265 [Streptomyces fradiae ATCC 10745 = DSM 40063]
MTRPDELRLEAARKRQELVETIDQLMAKTDLRARAARVDRRPVVAASAGTAALAVLGVVLAARRRARLHVRVPDRAARAHALSCAARTHARRARGRALARGRAGCGRRGSGRTGGSKR